MAIESKLITMTPEHAAELLRANHHNRRLSQKRVAFYVDQIDAGRWEVTGDGISVASTGRLLNGQHRLTAIVRAGKSVQVILTTGLSEDSFLVSDIGAKRSVSDVTGHPITLVADATLITYFTKGTFFKAAPRDILDIIDWWKPTHETILGVTGQRRRRGIDNSPVRVGIGLRWAIQKTKERRDYVLNQYEHMMSLDMAQMSKAVASFWQRTNRNPPGYDRSSRLILTGTAFHHLDPSRRDVIPIVRQATEMYEEIAGWLKLMPDAFMAGPGVGGHPYVFTSEPAVDRAVYGAAAAKKAAKK